MTDEMTKLRAFCVLFDRAAMNHAAPLEVDDLEMVSSALWFLVDDLYDKAKSVEAIYQKEGMRLREAQGGDGSKGVINLLMRSTGKRRRWRRFPSPWTL